MRRTAFTIVCSALFLFASSAAAQAVRTFVSTAGNDAASCGRLDPCRTFGAAMAVVNPRGEVVPLDSGGYGPFTITKSVSILTPPGIHAAIAPTATLAAIQIDGAHTDVVTLRGLVLNSQGSVSRGIRLLGAGTLFVDRCEVIGFGTGLAVEPHASGARFELTVSDSTFRDGSNGIFMIAEEFGTEIHATLNRCRLLNNNTGLLSRDRTRVTANHVIASGGVHGFQILTFFGPGVQVNVDDCVLTANSLAGLIAGHGAVVRVTESTISHNETGVLITGNGVVETLGNNLIEGNTTELSGSLTPIAAE